MRNSSGPISELRECSVEEFGLHDWAEDCEDVDFDGSSLHEAEWDVVESSDTYV